MTEVEISKRINRAYLALGDVSQLDPSEFEANFEGNDDDDGFTATVDFGGGNSTEALESKVATVINAIMGLRDRTKLWLKSEGRSTACVDQFIKSNLSASLVHDLANIDKHAILDRSTYSGVTPSFDNVQQAMTLSYDPATGSYASEGSYTSGKLDLQKFEQIGKSQSNGLEIAVTGKVLDENGNEVYRLERLLPDALYAWEQFLISVGVNL